MLKKKNKFYKYILNILLNVKAILNYSTTILGILLSDKLSFSKAFIFNLI